MPHSATVTITLARSVIDTFVAQGGTLDTLLEVVGLDRALLDDLDARLPFEQHLAVWRAAETLSGDPFIGLHYAERAQPSTIHVVGYAVQSSPTLRAAFQRMIQFQRLISEELRVESIPDDDDVRLRFHYDIPTELWTRQPIESALALAVVFARFLTGQQVRPESVHFRHSAPAEGAHEHRRVFQAPVFFSQAYDEVVFKASVLELPLLHADPNLCALLDSHATALLAQLPDENASVVDETRRALSRVLRDGEPTIEAIANELGMSGRTLQRRLQHEDSTFQTVLDTLRQDLAVRYLGEDRLSVGEVAFLLGFSSSSAFHRAFKRWTGSTPGAYRREAVSSSL